jgi:hypothetical protein
MRKYRVYIEANNFLLIDDKDGKEHKAGYFAYRFVEAENPLAAKNAAISMLRDRLPGARPLMDILSKVSFDVLEVLEDPSDWTVVQPGLILYQMNPKRWWQFWRRS